MSNWLTFALGAGAIYLLMFCWLAFVFVTAPLLDDEPRVVSDPHDQLLFPDIA